ncbi:Clavaminate synthase-like protein [Gonapodya prolifera JEL478]|uniref:Clavaminate synthase-like protein n=1 Tax=Gonapodya prolifera (strain JEL478) TaxID=1344416 RepID=A0A139APG7_GONPJ|nr:Clavaminate synthase-like protein [Gonapodya prolifera JEL478]|eukprot:KXS18639.1 Clavaminate synthase-like protein [Gonapodya prolifera JEL478]
MYSADTPSFVPRGSRSISTLPSFVTKDRTLTLSWSDAGVNETSTAAPHKSSFNYTWLRDHCQCPACVHPDTRQKLHSSADIPLDVKPTSIEVGSSPTPSVRIVWEDKPLVGRIGGPQGPHISVFDLAWLRKQDYDPAAVLARDREAMKIVPWDRAMLEKDTVGGLWSDYESFMKTDEGQRTVLEQMYLYGLAFLRGVPVNEQAIEGLCERLGTHVQETFYGKTFDVKSVPKANNIAYTSLYLGLHMDLMYFESPPGLQLLHSLQNTVTGGSSFFSDSFAAAERLRTAHPDEFAALTQVPVTFHYDNNGHHLRFRHPTISDYDGNEPMRVYYAPPFQGTLECEPEMVDTWYRAFARFREFTERPEMLYTHRLEPGECVIFNNRRVLHARDEFDPMSGDRFLKGAYVLWDAFKDKYRVHVQRHK